MNLLRVDAYSVSPQRGVDDPQAPVGGEIALTNQLRSVIDQSLKNADFASGTLVDFKFDLETRTNEVRDLFLAYTFGNDHSSAAENLAKRLSTCMDNRSKPCLLVSAIFEKKATRMATIWTFPQESALSFSTKPGRLSIEVLTDVFSQTSYLRKAAQFEGRNTRTSFLSGRVLDLQATDPSKEVADFWIKRFLNCTFALTPIAGTRILAGVLRKTFDTIEDLEDKESIYSAVVALRGARPRSLSLRKVAERLPDRARETFLKAAPDPSIVDSAFKFLRSELDDALQFRIFLLQTGVFVSSPLTQIGKSVNVTANGQRRLSCEGIIAEDKMRTRHA